MLAKKVDLPRETLLDPHASEWQKAAGEAVELKGAPLGLQPSPYVQASWRGKEIGKVKGLAVKSLHNGKEIFFHLEWKDPDRNEEVVNTNIFPDGAALLFPLNGDAPLITMGTKIQPVNAWYWRADFGERGQNNVAQGLGTTRVTEKSHIFCRALWQGGTWHLIVTRPLAVADQQSEAIQLEPGKAVKVSFAVWEGGNGERAGVKAFSEIWHELAIEG